MTRDFIGYGRISRIGDRAERLRSDKDQKAEIAAAAKARGLRLLRIEFDYDESGATRDRPRLTLAIEAIERGEAAGIIVARLDRFSRDTRHTWELAERIHDAGGVIYSYAEQTDWTTPSGELQVGLIATFARFQRRILADSFARAKAGAVAAGIPVTTRMAPGLRLIHDDRGRRIGVEHDEEVADAIAEAFAMRARGEGPRMIADHLAAHRVHTSMGATNWSKQAIYGLLKNRAYLGELWNGEHVNRNAWAPIVDEATWLAAQRPGGRAPTAPRRPERAGRTYPDLAVGLARCATCRYCLQATTTTRDRRVYRCNKQHAGGTCPNPARMYADDLEPLLLAAFWQLARTHHARSAAAGDATIIDVLRRRADRARRKWEMHRDDPDVDQTIDVLGGLNEWRAWMTRHREVAEAATAALARALAERTRPDLPDETTLRADWDTMPREIKRRHLASLIDCVALLPVSCGLPPERRAIVFAAGTGPHDLPRRGYRASPTIRPFEVPPGTGVL